MGPGYFPRILGILLIALGLALARARVAHFRTADSRLQVAPAADRALERRAFGLIVDIRRASSLSTIFLIVASSAASHEFRLRESVVAGVALAALAVGVFVIG